MFKTTTRRWSGNDKHFWKFTYASDEYKNYGIVLRSGDEEYKGCNLMLQGFGHTLILDLPPIIKPYAEKVKATYWSAEAIKQMGRDWYYNYHEREYSIKLSGGDYLQVFYGRKTHSSTDPQQWGYFLPWTQFRSERFSLYDTEGKLLWSYKPYGWNGYEEQQRQEALCPSVTFEFADYDGEIIQAKTLINERESLRGEKWFKWASLFCKPMVWRTLNIEFSKEVGREKGSWKGGTLGHGIETTVGELHESAFRRYCTENQLSFIRVVK